MLKLRVMTAVLLLALALGAWWGGAALWAVAVTLALLLCWPEWCALAGLPRRWYVLGAAALLLLLLLGYYLWPLRVALYVLALLLWLVSPYWLKRGHMPPPMQMLGIGLLWLSAAGLGAFSLHHSPTIFPLSLFGGVFAADIAAYFGGRAWGQRKLAPSISPNKTTAGLWSALAATFLLAVLALYFSPHAVSLSHSLIYLTLVPALVLLSVWGDLLESWFKRQRGVKDSGRILPGHGGLLDRFDSLLPVLPLVGCLAEVYWR